MKRLLIGAAIAFLALAGVIQSQKVLHSQTIFIPKVTTLSPTNDAIQVIPNSAPVVGNVYAPPALITNVYGYYKGGAVVTNFVYTFGPNVTFAMFQPTGTLAWGYFYLAAAPSDGARNCIFSTQTLTGATVYANTGQSIDNAVTTIAANSGICYVYSLSNATWDRN